MAGQRVKRWTDTVWTALLCVAGCAAAAKLVIGRPTQQSGISTVASTAVASIPTLRLSLDGAHLQGATSARIAVVEFSEFECPFCGRFATEILPSISRRYIEPGLVLWAFRHRPFEAIHANAVRASEAAECAAEENRFWQMHDMMFRDQSHLDTTGLLAMAKRVGLGSKFEACLATNSTEGVVRSDLAAATKSGIDSTPTFLIGRINDGVVSVSVRILGAEPESTFARVLDELLKDAPDKDDAAKGRGGPP